MGTGIQTIGLKDAIRRAIEITSSFEGNDCWGSVAGDFDGQGITCGALGFAWSAGVHQKIVVKAEEMSPGIVLRLMPTHGSMYLWLCSLPVKLSMPKIKEWSDKGGMLDPLVKRELQALWKAIDEAQIWAAEAVYVRQALADMNRWKRRSLREFCLMFDFAVQSGSFGQVPGDVQGHSAQEMIALLQGATEEQAGYRDAHENAKLWRPEQLSSGCRELFIATGLRAKRSNARWVMTVLNRRGTILFGQGWVNRSLRRFEQIKEIDLEV